MKILLISPPSGAIISKSFNMPLGVCALKSFLIQNGQDAIVLDLNIKTFLYGGFKILRGDSNLKYWMNKKLFDKVILPKLDINKMLDEIFSHNAGIIGFSVTASSLNSSVVLVKEIRKRSKINIVFGGAFFHESNVEAFLREGIDAIVTGEGEQTLLELSRDFKLCKGVYMLQDDKLVYGGNRELLDINTLPFPNFDDIIDDYREISSEIWLSTSFIRGCTHRCSFCDESPFWQRARQRSPEKIIEELTYLSSKYNSYRFHKGDSVIADSPETLNKICDLIIKNNLKLQWYSQARPEKWLSFELLQKMHQAGCSDLSYGVESGSQKILDLMNKKLNIKEIVRIIQDTKKAGINVYMTIMVDSPNETLIDFLKTITFIFKTRKYLFSFMVSSAGILPRSDWHKNPSKYNIVFGNNWHSKNYINNPITAKIKFVILEMIGKALLIRK